MRRLTTAIALVLLPLAAASVFNGAARRAPQCPTVKVSCADTAACLTSVTFAAEVSGAAADAKLSYNWTASAGRITGGQGTAVITVDLTGVAGTSVEATVQVAGLPETCSGKATCATAIICDPLARKFDEYGNIRWSTEKGRLDNFAVELQNDRTPQGYIICYGGRIEHAGEALRRCHRAASYITKLRGIDAARMVTVDGGYREASTVELWLVGSGVTPPTTAPTVDPKDVQFIKDHRPKRRRHR